MKKSVDLRQLVAPISKAMDAYAGDGALAFHTPGHKQGLGAHPLLRRLITSDGLRQEVSLMEELDDLHTPFGCIKEAEELAAELWGARRTLFQINGTTGAIHAMLLGTLNPGDKVLVPRNAHQSIMGGIILSGAVPIFVQPEIDLKLGIPMGVTLETLRSKLAENDEIKAVVMVYPTYYGVAADLQAIADFLHQREILLLVDEAHGAHLKFSDELPKQALDCGADVVAQSTHKLLGSMTQTSMLHIGSDRVDLVRIEKAAALLQSTSPNQLLLASLDIARLQMAEDGGDLLKRAVELSQWLRREINAIPGLYCPGDEILGGTAVHGLDYTKITVNLSGIGMSGIRAEEILRHEYKVQCELSDPRNILFIISMADRQQECERLVEVLRDLAMRAPEVEVEKPFEGALELNRIPEMKLSFREAFFGECEKVIFEHAVGRISAETIVFYPPGVPVLCPGEEINDDVVSYVRQWQSVGMRVVGPADTSLKYIKVMR